MPLPPRARSRPLSHGNRQKGRRCIEIIQLPCRSRESGVIDAVAYTSFLLFFFAEASFFGAGWWWSWRTCCSVQGGLCCEFRYGWCLPSKRFASKLQLDMSGDWRPHFSSPCRTWRHQHSSAWLPESSWIMFLGRFCIEMSLDAGRWTVTSCKINQNSDRLACEEDQWQACGQDSGTH